MKGETQRVTRDGLAGLRGVMLAIAHCVGSSARARPRWVPALALHRHPQARARGGKDRNAADLQAPRLGAADDDAGDAFSL